MMSQKSRKQELRGKPGRGNGSKRSRAARLTRGVAPRFAALFQPDLPLLDWPSPVTQDAVIPRPRIRLSTDARSLGQQPEPNGCVQVSTGDGVPGRRANGCGRHRRNWALALYDSANMYCTLMRALGNRSPRPEEEIDLASLYRKLRDSFNVKRFLYVIRDNPDRSYGGLQDYVKRCHCTWKAVRRSTRTNRDPCDVFIIERLRAATSTLDAPALGPKTVILLSHDGDFAPACRAYLRAGGCLVLAGFIGAFSKRLYNVSGHPRCQIIDLRFDLSVLGQQTAHR